MYGPVVNLDEPLLTDDDLCRRWKCSRRHLARLRKGWSGRRLPHLRLGRLVRYRPEEVAGWEAELEAR